MRTTKKFRQSRAGPSLSRERAKWLSRVDLASFFVRAPAVLVLLDPDLKVLMASERLADASGIPVRELAGKRPSEVLPLIGARVEPILRRVAATGRPRNNFELAGELPTSPGVLRYWKASCFPAARAGDGRYAIGVIATETTNASPLSLLRASSHAFVKFWSWRTRVSGSPIF